MTSKEVTLGSIAWIDAKIVDPTSTHTRDLPHVSAENIASFTGELLGVKSASEDGVTSGKYNFDAGDVLYSKLRPYLRKATIPDFSGLCSADMYPLKTDETRILPEFLRLVLVGSAFTDYAIEESARTRMPKLNREQLFSYRFILPSLAYQRSVVSAVKLAAVQIHTARSSGSMQLSEVRPLTDAVYRRAFEATIPVAVPPVNREPPPGWHWHKLSDVARLESGHTPSKHRPDWWGGDISWLSLTEIRALDGKWVDVTQIRTNPQGIKNSAARVLPRGTVCLSRTASVGFVAIMGRPMATSQDFANWICGEDLDPDFLMYALIRSRTSLREMAMGATHKTIYMPALQSFHICAPGIDEQKRIANNLRSQLAEIGALHIALTQRAQDLSALPQRILASAFEE